MVSLENKSILVIGLGASGVAAAECALRGGARVYAVDTAITPAVHATANKLRQRGVRVELGAVQAPPVPFDYAVVSPGVPPENPIYASLRESGIPVISELEFGFQASCCLNIAITGTNGKTTTTEVIERLLRQNGIKTLAAGNIGLPISAVAEESRELDFLTLEVSSFQLERIEFFRPAIAVLLNITPDHLDRYPSMAEYIAAKAQLFKNQQPFDWAIIQKEALKTLQEHGVKIPSKIITFSATDKTADIIYDRGLIISQLENWTGPLLNMDDALLRGPHNAENLMAALAVARVLRISFEGTVGSLKTYSPAAHRCEVVAEYNGVKFVNDSKATNLDAVQKAIATFAPAGRDRRIILIAGGKDKGYEFHDLGPTLDRYVKKAYLIGETREKIRAAWSLFTPCTLCDSLIEAVAEAAGNAESGDIVLLSPACSSFDQFRNYQHRGDVFKEAVRKQAEPQDTQAGGLSGAEKFKCLAVI